MIISFSFCTKQHYVTVQYVLKYVRITPKKENDYRRYHIQSIILHYNLGQTETKVSKITKRTLRIEN